MSSARRKEYGSDGKCRRYEVNEVNAWNLLDIARKKRIPILNAVRIKDQVQRLWCDKLKRKFRVSSNHASGKKEF